MVIIWAARFIIYFGLTLNVAQFGSNVVLNFTGMGLSELIASLLSAPIKRNFSRKRSMQTSLIVCAVSCLAVYFLYFPFVFSLCKKKRKFKI